MIIVVCQYYLQLKQQSLNNKLEKLYNQLIKRKQHESAIKSDQYWINLRFNNELTKINKLYGNLLKEIFITNEELKWFTTIMFVCLIMAQTYMTCVILLVEVPIAFLLLFAINLFVNDSLLSIMIYSSSRIEYQNRKFAYLERKFLFLYNCWVRKNIFFIKNKLKVSFFSCIQSLININIFSIYIWI